MSVRVRVILLALLLLVTMVTPVVFSDPSSASPSEIASRMNMERAPFEAQRLAETDLPTNAAAEAPSTTDIILTARFNYSSENGLGVLPCKGGTVQLWRVGAHSSFVERNGTTDGVGKVIFTNLTAGQFELVILTSDQRYVEVRDTTILSNTVYEWSTGVFTLSSSSSINHRITDEDRGAWSAYEAARAGALWIKDQTGFEMNEVTINWPSGTWPSSSGAVIDIPAEDGHIWDQGTILHEYGHCIHYTVRGGSFPYTEGLDPHYIDSVSNGPFALTEGWAEFFERAVLGDPVRSDGSNMESTVYADGPFFNGDYGDWDGNTVEGAVANVIWDIYDGVSPTDNPSWDPEGSGDWTDSEFDTFWTIFRDDKPQSMVQVYNAWPDKNDSLRTIFYHARFQIDLGYPLNPTTYDSSHKVMEESDDSTVEVTWSGAIDYAGNIAGYSIIWDGEPDTVPDDSIDTVMAKSKSPALTEGIWYLHIRAVNVDGNAANGSYNVGPFIIAANATDQDSGGGSWSIEGWEMVVLVVFAIVVAISVIGVARIIKRPDQDTLPPQDTQYGAPWVPPTYTVINTSYAPPPPPPPSVGGPLPPENPDGARFCRNCGRTDVGGTFCPFCGFKLR